MEKELLNVKLTEEKLLGLPLKEAAELLSRSGLEYSVTGYSSLRGVEGAEDERVLRARIEGGCARLVVSKFVTEI